MVGVWPMSLEKLAKREQGGPYAIRLEVDGETVVLSLWSPLLCADCRYHRQGVCELFNVRSALRCSECLKAEK